MHELAKTGKDILFSFEESIGKQTYVHFLIFVQKIGSEAKFVLWFSWF